jgi:hypothetical protein
MILANSRTFIDHYRIWRHRGLQEIMCGLNPDEEFSRAVTRMSRWIDRRRPRYLNDDDRALVEKDPELQAAVRWQFELEIQCDRSDDPALREMLEDQERKVRNLRRSLQEKPRKEVRRNVSRKQAVVDIQRQLSGRAVDDESAREVLRQEFSMPPQQILAVEAFSLLTSVQHSGELGGLVNLSALIRHVVVDGLFPADHLSLRTLLVLAALHLSVRVIFRLFNTDFVEWTAMGPRWARWIQPVEEAGQSVQHSGGLVKLSVLISHEEDKCSALKMVGQFVCTD